jgi:hypothetical protein
MGVKMTSFVNILIALALLLLPTPSLAKDTVFSYSINTLDGIKKFQCVEGGPYERAFDTCSSACYDHFVFHLEPKTNDAKLKIIDTCANPNSNQKNWQVEASVIY